MRILRDIPYATRPTRDGGTSVLAFDAYLPDGPGPSPAVVLAFGGAFHRGSKEDDAFPTAGAHGPNTAMAEYARRFAEAGFCAFSVRYRLAPEEPLPGDTPVIQSPSSVPMGRIAQVREIMGLPPATPEGMAEAMEAAIDDVADAARAVRARAGEYGVDPGLIVLGGWSAGARCALYAAFGECVPCAGVVALSGAMQPDDLSFHLARPGPRPPVLFVSAEADLPYLGRDALAAQVQALAEAGVAARQVEVPGRDHWYPAEAATDAGGTVWDTMLGAVRGWTRGGADALLRDFAEAFNRHDVEALLGMVTEDCVFETAFGPEPHGTRHVGKAALREAFPIPWRTWPDARWEQATHVVAGDRAFSEWTLRGRGPGGTIETRGVDLFVLRDGLIARKDTFRKSRTPPA